MKKTIIWSNSYNSTMECAKELQSSEPNITDEEAFEDASDILSCQLNTIREEMNIKTNGIVAIADIGRWNGRFQGYKEIGDSISDCFYNDCEFVEWYVDGYGNLRLTGEHHDGKNYILYREWKDGITQEQKESLFSDIYYRKEYSAKLYRLTKKLGPYFL